jgi:excinuclease ABC subunit C
MIAQAVTRRYTRLRDEGQTFPDLIILDGGLTQLRAAREALSAIGVAGIPTVGLAKRFEELVTDDGHPPLFLPRDSDGLMVVTRLRDEAHRFAITYNRRLRQKRIRESVLDEVQGVGESKKARLLRAFGSVRRLAEADADAVAKAGGVSREIAEEILRVCKGRGSAPEPFA